MDNQIADQLVTWKIALALEHQITEQLVTWRMALALDHQITEQLVTQRMALVSYNQITEQPITRRMALVSDNQITEQIRYETQAGNSGCLQATYTGASYTHSVLASLCCIHALLAHSLTGTQARLIPSAHTLTAQPASPGAVVLGEWECVGGQEGAEPQHFTDHYRCLDDIFWHISLQLCFAMSHNKKKKIYKKLKHVLSEQLFET